MTTKLKSEEDWLVLYDQRQLDRAFVRAIQLNALETAVEIAATHKNICEECKLDIRDALRTQIEELKK